MDGGAWWAIAHGVAKSQTRLSDFTFPFHFHALEKEMATHSSVSCLENPRDGGASWAAIYGVAESRTRLKRVSSSSSSSRGEGNSKDAAFDKALIFHLMQLLLRKELEPRVWLLQRFFFAVFPLAVFSTLS